MAAFAKQGIDRPDLFSNTVKIGDSIGEYPYYKGLDLLPKPKNADPDILLELQAWEGLKARGLEKKPEYKERLREELDIIKAKNFSTYFLIVADMVQWAKDQGIMVGPGRGSGAGSLLNYTLRITDVDPIKYGLLFFRFIDPERPTSPTLTLTLPTSVVVRSRNICVVSTATWRLLLRSPSSETRVSSRTLHGSSVFLSRRSTAH
jgi:DNA polymerase-3 subunit alpha